MVKLGTAKIDRHAEIFAVGEAAPADAVANFDQFEADIAGLKAARRRQPGSARPDDNDVGVGGAGGAGDERCSDGAGAGGQEGASADFWWICHYPRPLDSLVPPAYQHQGWFPIDSRLFNDERIRGRDGKDDARGGDRAARPA